ncbi:MAG: hypothetical protein WC346_16250 [Methanogenium sp.]|jgi:hypothetical protein
MGRDIYSNFGWLVALPSGVRSAAVAGETIDVQAFDAVTFIVNGTSCDSAAANSAADCFKLTLQHGLASAAGVSAWSVVPGSQLIHSVYGGYTSTGETGLFAYGFQSTMNSGATMRPQVVGYKKDVLHRYVRFYLSISGNPSTCWIGAAAVTGYPNHWPVNESVEG